MKPIESARAFALRLGDMVEAEFADSGVDLDLPEMTAAIEADRNAVRLALLEELVAAWAHQPIGSKRPVLDAIDELRAKYGATSPEAAKPKP